MSSRIIRSREASKKAQVSAGSVGGPTGDLLAIEHPISVEKQAFEQGYKEGERVGRQLGESVVEPIIKRYDQGVSQLADLHRKLSDAMEIETVRLALEIARKIIQREAAIDPDMVSVLVSVALKRVHGHHGIEARVSSHDYIRVCEAIRTTNASIPVKEDASLERGDFIIDTVETHLDGRISSQIDAVSRALFDE